MEQGFGASASRQPAGGLRPEPLRVSAKGAHQAPGKSARHFIIMDALGLLPPTLAQIVSGEVA